MRALVVYESIFGNTRSVALAIAEGLAKELDVEVVEVSEAPPALPSDLDILVIGGPTHGHGLTNPKSRANGAERAGVRLVSRGAGIREWLERLVPGPTPPAAAFDTRIKGPALLWGSAASGAAKLMRSLGFDVLMSTSFVVGGPGGEPFDRISPEELVRARAWGETLAATVGSSRLVPAR
jgi:hypothetical protein